MSNSRIVWLDRCAEAGIDAVGGKAVGLGHLLGLDLPVPPGFAVATDTYREHLHRTALFDRVDSLIEGLPSVHAVESVSNAADQIEELFAATVLAGDLASDIQQAYKQLGEPPVAIRSSATTEDTADASFAGQQESYLWIRGVDAVLDHVTRCWASLFTAQAISYRLDRGLSSRDIAMSVVIQEMVPASAAGVMLTLDPVTGDPSQVTIEACYGLGVGVVGSEVTPDRFAVDKVGLSIRQRLARRKESAYEFDDATGEVRKVSVPSDRQSELCLTDGEATGLARLGKGVEQRMGRAQDIEWALGPGEPDERELYLLQTRPETVWTNKAHEPLTAKDSTAIDRMLTMMHTPIRLKK